MPQRKALAAVTGLLTDAGKAAFYMMDGGNVYAACNGTIRSGSRYSHGLSVGAQESTGRAAL